MMIFVFAKFSISDIVFSPGITEIVSESFNYVSVNGNIDIPNTVEIIRENSFNYCSSIINITFPKSLKIVERNTFWYLDNITSINFECDNVSVVGSFWYLDYITTINFQCKNVSIANSFIYFDAITTIIYNYTKIEEWNFKRSCDFLVIGNLVECIGANAFSNGIFKHELVIPDSVTEIGDKAFYQSQLNSISIIGNKLEIIGNSAFEGAKIFKEINIPNSVTTIGTNAFKSCPNLNNINIDPDNKHYTSINGVLLSKDKKTIICYPSGKTENQMINIEATVIKSYAFYSCSFLTGDLVIPKSIIKIEENAFDNNKKLENINVDQQNEFYSSSYGILLNKSKTCVFYCPEGKTGTIKLEKSIKTISDYAFSGCELISGSIDLPHNIEVIGKYSFSGCKNINKKLIIPISVKEIGYYAFNGCTKIPVIYYLGYEDPKFTESAFQNTNIPIVIVPHNYTSTEFCKKDIIPLPSPVSKTCKHVARYRNYRFSSILII